MIWFPILLSTLVFNFSKNYSSSCDANITTSRRIAFCNKLPTYFSIAENEIYTHLLYDIFIFNPVGNGSNEKLPIYWHGQRTATRQQQMGV